MGEESQCSCMRARKGTMKNIKLAYYILLNYSVSVTASAGLACQKVCKVLQQEAMPP